MLALKNKGQLEAIKQNFRITREGGFCGFDIFLLLLYMFASQQRRGISAFAKKAKPYNHQLASLAQRKTLPSPSSVSRALEKAERSTNNEIMNLLLVEYSGALEVMSHEACQTYDAIGKPWHIFDFDPTITTLRQRALPMSKELPLPKRRSQHLKPGYKGRKRGNVQLKRAAIQHHGSGIWIGAWYDTGNGNSRKEMKLALEAIQKTCRRLPQPCERAIIRADGEFGNVPCISACQKANIDIITRLTRTSWFRNKDFLNKLSQLKWEPVPDSKSGPVRESSELGWTVLKASPKTLDEDDMPYEPIEVRVVVSRFKPKGKSSCGVSIDGWQYELFVTTLRASAWPHQEVVSAYFGRIALENRFFQEDRELNLDHIFSYHIPGQELAAQIGLFVWNVRISMGFSMNPLPKVIPFSQKEQKPIPPESAIQSDTVPVSEPEKSFSNPEESESSSKPPEELVEEKNELLISLLNEQNWPCLLKRRPDWSWDCVNGKLLCPSGKPLMLNTMEKKEQKGHVKVYFRGVSGMCDGCPHLSRCYHRPSSVPTKVASFLFPFDSGCEIKSLLAGIRQRKKSTRPTKKPKTSPVFRPSSTPGPERIRHSLFLPAIARQAFRCAASNLTAFVTVQTAPSSPARHPYLARSLEERRHQRKSWSEKLERYALAPGSVVQLTLSGADSLKPYF